MVWSNGLSPGAASGSSRPRSRRAAIAMPTALPTPWPSGPVVISTPGVWPVLGVARGQRAPLAQVGDVLDGQAVAGQEQLHVERQAGVAAGQHEAVAPGPGGSVGSCRMQALVEQVRGRREAHRRAGVARAGGLHRVHGERARHVDRGVGRGRSTRAAGRCSPAGPCSRAGPVVVGRPRARRCACARGAGQDRVRP